MAMIANDVMHARLDHEERRLVRWLARHSLTVLRMGMGLVFVWFGVLKFFPGESPAEDLALGAIDVLTFGIVPAAVSLPLLAMLECAIGVGLLTGRFLRLTLVLLAVQMAGALSPLVLMPGEMFRTPWAATLEGQYVLKDIILVAAGMVLGATVRGGRLVSEPGSGPTHPPAGGTQPVSLPVRRAA